MQIDFLVWELYKQNCKIIGHVQTEIFIAIHYMQFLIQKNHILPLYVAKFMFFAYWKSNNFGNQSLEKLEVPRIPNLHFYILFQIIFWY